MLRPHIAYTALFMAMSAVSLASEKSGASFSEGHKVSQALAIHTDKPSSRFFGSMPSPISPLGSFLPSPLGAYGLGGFPSYPYLHSSPYQLMGGPLNYGGMYPQNPGYFGNSFGAFSASQQQQQQQQQQSHAGVGSGFGGFQPTFSG